MVAIIAALTSDGHLVSIRGTLEASINEVVALHNSFGRLVHYDVHSRHTISFNALDVLWLI